MSACGSVSTPLPERILLKRYDHFSSILDNDNLADLKPFFTSRLQADMKDASGKNSAIEAFSVLGFLQGLPYKRESSFERRESGKGCLTINGFDKEGAPLTINVEFLDEGNLWKVNETHLSYFDDKKDFLDHAACPSEVLTALEK